jgi:hypothetical protein
MNPSYRTIVQPPAKSSLLDSNRPIPQHRINKHSQCTQTNVNLEENYVNYTDKTSGNMADTGSY